MPWPAANIVNPCINAKVSDDSGKSFVFSIRPTAARGTLRDRGHALDREVERIRFGDGALAVHVTGKAFTYARGGYETPIGWGGIDRIRSFRRFEIWRLIQ